MIPLIEIVIRLAVSEFDCYRNDHVPDRANTDDSRFDSKHIGVRFPCPDVLIGTSTGLFIVEIELKIVGEEAEVVFSHRST
jgi:hypothetical protein